MIAVMLLAAAAAPTAVDAEHAFARDAQRTGQWTAFRTWADRDAVMFTPKAVWARDFLEGRKDPSKAISWRPSDSFVSCDGHTAVNTGPWFETNGELGGYFTTVWQWTNHRWRWAYDGGVPRGKETKAPYAPPKIHHSSCATRAPGPPIIPPPPLTSRQARTTPEDNGRGQSADKTLGWDWKVDKRDVRYFRVYSWNGYGYAQVLYNEIPPK